MDRHNMYMQRCIELAQLGAGYVSPNPMVGAVIVYKDKIIGEGYHQKYGGPHAEVNAVNDALTKHPDAEQLLKQSTIYVSLEPCAHYGKTPPCADLIIKHQIQKVVIGCRDPFDAVNGKGIEKLMAAGVDVQVGVLEQECEDLNKRFFTRVQKQRPYVILKWALTANGYFAPADGSQFWITKPEAKTLVHKWRAEENAILVGKNTVLADDPKLNVRYWTGNNPKRIVIDRSLEIDQSFAIYDQSVETIIFNEVKTGIEGKVKYIALEDFDKFVPQYILFQLYLQDIQSVIIEGGAQTLNSFIEAGLWDEARVFTGSAMLQNGVFAPLIGGQLFEHTMVGNDMLKIYHNK
ncbi:bifunctional diaminohydroxyphosphoribosylaminopyrimidine deaminase/5-amino-6-(5-phosphoribosylamino)uracil reductase RibD [Mucilaginibacter ginkgonis]|uniref:Riboflavin biosynthesis protein RibD n=1 Tax=Mucilaginibacter ginkgonis TaxID=2682091 RepID=A0A6I4HVY7_9SPHI|nr:bifunctional diaminohydroxyphosphoribosylaminopyrimidine deaminase/5-amino-6-(5-phosphoribosylamino)uracil reductase RibD [Mucilaginibacter ginkgonis]QQL51112.1 bifunctional diaminohydroxyphosphoribosylaminopyrimidine deaminase/5-amino-6-(5-phosphoribosylamino)uracil reductase RibD [Mucilaginibacter ginkgonis]